MDFLTSGLNVVLIILGFGILIFVHELGHFIAAKWAGIRAEAFAVGMGPVALAWRKGIGLRFGSTAPDYEKRVRQFLSTDEVHKLDSARSTQHSALPQAEMYRIGDKLGLGETEYSLRWLPIGGFVKMLGQEDANPNYVSNDPRSYTMCPVGKRMIVVSAGVIMNIILAVILFIIAFMIGVKFEAPVVGDAPSTLPAGRTMAENAAALGIKEPGLQSGDLVMQIDGSDAQTFADLQIASAMSRPGVPVELVVQRAGFSVPLRFRLNPAKDPVSGLLSIGISPASSTTLLSKDDGEVIQKILKKTGLSEAGVQLGMQMIRAGGQSVQTYEQFRQQVQDSEGKSIVTEWTAIGKDGAPSGPVVSATIPVEPAFGPLAYADDSGTDAQNAELGLLGMVPLAQVEDVLGSANVGILHPGDVILRVGSLNGPRIADLQREVGKNPSKPLELTVLRDGREVTVTANVDRKGKLNVGLVYARDLPMIAQPMNQVRTDWWADDAESKAAANRDGDHAKVVRTPVADLRLEGLGGTRIEAIGGAPVNNWADIRRELRAQTQLAHQSNSGATVQVRFTLPTPGKESESLPMSLSARDVAFLHELGWQTELPPGAFDHVYTTRSAKGNPLRAAVMGFEETKKFVMMTYLTIDRLFRGTVGVEQLRGPVGIIHIGVQVADKGMTYLIFLLGMISVNLAVINFLPMPIVDGGLFLFLIYEKFKGRPPSLAFQNAATIIGLCLIITMFVVVTWNDVLRLVG